MKRVMCVFLPQWPLQRLVHDRPELRDKPLVLTRPRSAGGTQVALCSAAARRLGVRADMPLAEALAVAPTLIACPEDPDADRRTLTRLAEWANRYSPIVGLEEALTPSSLLLDVTGCAACFGGEDKLLDKATRAFAERGWRTHIAVADTIGAAWAFTHCLRFALAQPVQARDPASAKRKRDLPVAALRLPADSLHLLRELGIDRVADLVALPRDSLPGRFGAIVVQRLDQLFGRLPEPIAPLRPLPDVMASCAFDCTTERRDVVLRAADHLLERIVQQLRERHRGARRLDCLLYHEIAAPVRVEVGLSRPSRSAAHLSRLLHTQLEQTRLVEPVCGVCLSVPLIEKIAEHQVELFEGDARRNDGEFALLLDGLTSRLGEGAVTVARLVADPQPELACRFESALSPRAPPLTPFDWEVFYHRPLQVWPAPLPIEVMAVVPEGSPVRFRRADMEYDVTRAWGPERIETGWWRGDDVQRDYYIVDTHLGTRLWIFRRHDDGRWFWHGCFT